jgi:prepilin-type N-terminal cleavage/methylation domain-containing protein
MQIADCRWEKEGRAAGSQRTANCRPASRFLRPLTSDLRPLLRTARGFTLIEIMVAVAVLAMLVLVMSTIFHQSSLAWDSGTGRMRANTAARALLNFMEKELAHAVADDLLRVNVDTRDGSNPNPDKGFSTIRFWTVEGTNSAQNRVVRRIEYKEDPNNGTAVRSEWVIPANQMYGTAVTNRITGAPDSEIVMAENVTRLKFQGWPETGNDGFGVNRAELPRGVKIMLSLRRRDRVSNLAARSSGPDGQIGTGDDITSW